MYVCWGKKNLSYVGPISSVEELIYISNATAEALAVNNLGTLKILLEKVPDGLNARVFMIDKKTLKPIYDDYVMPIYFVKSVECL